MYLSLAIAGKSNEKSFKSLSFLLFFSGSVFAVASPLEWVFRPKCHSRTRILPEETAGLLSLHNSPQVHLCASYIFCFKGCLLPKWLNFEMFCRWQVYPLQRHNELRTVQLSARRKTIITLWFIKLYIWKSYTLTSAFQVINWRYGANGESGWLLVLIHCENFTSHTSLHHNQMHLNTEDSAASSETSVSLSKIAEPWLSPLGAVIKLFLWSEEERWVGKKTKQILSLPKYAQIQSSLTLLCKTYWQVLRETLQV